LAIDVVKADGMYITDRTGKQWLDLIGGISVCNTGHRHPKIVEAVKQQLDAYMHVLVYGEMIESPQVEYANWLTNHLHSSLNSVYFTNSGTEATEGALKLAKRVTGRTQLAGFNLSYHGSTQGSLSVMGDEYWRNAFRPLLPDVLHLEYNSFDSINAISTQTACVIVETVQAERGVYASTGEWLLALRRKCDSVGSLLIMDEIQTGFGRTGTLWNHTAMNVFPDILLLGKALGGGMPLGAFIADRALMAALTDRPVLGHITTFGGHPVSCAAGLAAAKLLTASNWISEVQDKAALFVTLLRNSGIKAVRSAGLLLSVEFADETIAKKIIDRCIEKGVLVDWFLFAPQCMRIAPPLIISDNEIKKACDVIIQACDEIK